jgi:hypothetical protein
VAAGRSLHTVDAQTGVMGGLENGAFVLHSVCATKPVETLRVPLGGDNSGSGLPPCCARPMDAQPITSPGSRR